MATEGEYLEMVNDLKDQYLSMKERLSRELALKDAELRYFMIERGFKSPLSFTTDMFVSSRPPADSPRYTDTVTQLNFYNCSKCNGCHPKQSICYI